MIIYTVKTGDSIYSIAREFGVPPSRIITENELENPSRLVIGQTLVIRYPSVVYTVRGGDTLFTVGEKYSLTVGELLRLNPALGGELRIYPGQTLNIAFDEPKLGEFEVNGYAYPFIDRSVLRATLPFLTYLTIFTYGIMPDGSLITIDDDEIIALAREYGVAPVMLISTLSESGKFESSIASRVLNTPEVQNRLINEIIATMQAKKYYGIDVDFEYILPEDGDKYVAFIENLRSRAAPLGFKVFVALAPKTGAGQTGLLYQGHNYSALGEAADGVLLMTYEWGFTYGPPMAVAPINMVGRVVDYAVTEIEPGKISLGIPNYGYDFTLPYVRGTSKAQSISNVGAVELAGMKNAAIEFDMVAASPFFRYYERTPSGAAEHEVWFEDARSIEAKLALARDSDLRGVSYWTVMKYFPQNWLVLSSQYNIAGVL